MRRSRAGADREKTMFTGIVEELGRVEGIDLAGPDAELRIQSRTVAGDVRRGDSIAVSGVCLTVVRYAGETFTVDVMAETLLRTTIGGWRPGTMVNVERSVTPTTRLGGHLVQGHVDGAATLVGRERHPGYHLMTFAAASSLARYIAGKGAIAVDGVSLTVIDVQDTTEGAKFTIGLIPHTQRVTTLGDTPVGARVNVEVDVMAKYVERLLTASKPAAAGATVAGTDSGVSAASMDSWVPVGGNREPVRG